MLSKINSFDDFLFEQVDEVSFILSNDLIDVLKEIEHPISRKLLEDNAQANKKKITYIDILFDDYNKWSFVNSVKVIQYLDELNQKPSYVSLDRYGKEIKEKFKSVSRIGRLINKLYPEQFKPTDIEVFVNKYKQHFIKDFDLIDIVKGDKIKYWYDCKRYNDTGYGTELNNSCMSPSSRNEYMSFYAVNDDKVSMVILYSDESKTKIDARAILWKPDMIDGKKNEKGDLFLDRIYYNNQEHLNILQKYAANKGWYYKYDNNSSIGGKIYNPYTKEKKFIPMFIYDVKIPENKKFPYVDTLAVFDPETNTISNVDEGKKMGYLSSMSGDIDGLKWIDNKEKFYHVTDLVEADGISGVEVVLKEDAIYMPYYNTTFTKEYYDSKEKVKVEDPNKTEGESYKYEVFKEDTVDVNGKPYFKRDVVWSDFMDEYLLKKDAVYSDFMDTYIYRKDAVEVVSNLIHFGGLNYGFRTEWLHLDDPREPYFKYKGIYYMKDLVYKYPEYFKSIGYKKDFED